MRRALPLFFLLVALPFRAMADYLTVGDVWGRSPVIAYEIPEADGREEAIRYVESMRDELKQGALVLDAAADPSSLKGKLKGGFVLYTTLSGKSNLLRLATRKLGLEFSGGDFHWLDLTAPSGELRLILVGRNPYSKGYCAIFAAGSNRALTGINSLPQGNSSYHIFQGSQLLREGNYDQTLVPVERVSKAAALEDANQLFSTLKRVHPNLLEKVSADDYRDLKARTAADIASKIDAHGEIPVGDLASLLYYACAYFKDGHTSLHWGTSLNERNTRGKRFPALRLAFDNGRFAIAAAREGTLVGTELVAVNGAPVLEFLRPILDRQSGETLGFRAARFLRDEPFWHYLTNLFGAGGPYTLSVRDAQGQLHQAALETLNYADYQAFQNQDKARQFQPNDQGTKVEFLDSGATAHFLYSHFWRGAVEQRKIDGLFQEIKAKGARNLILDLRGNGGGESDAGEYLFRYLYGGKFRAVRTLRIKVSRDILPDLPWWARPVGFVLSGRVFSLHNGEHLHRKPGAFFSGRTYLLIDNGTYSMAGEFAAMFRDYKVGTMLGYETGGLPITYGNPHHFTLKNSRIPATVSWGQILPPKPWPGDDAHGVIPDVPLSGRKLAGFAGERDPVLAFTLRYIASGATPPPAAQ